MVLDVLSLVYHKINYHTHIKFKNMHLYMENAPPCCNNVYGSTTCHLQLCAVHAHGKLTSLAEPQDVSSLYIFKCTLCIQTIWTVLPQYEFIWVRCKVWVLVIDTTNQHQWYPHCWKLHTYILWKQNVQESYNIIITDIGFLYSVNPYLCIKMHVVVRWNCVILHCK